MQRETLPLSESVLNDPRPLVLSLAGNTVTPLIYEGALSSLEPQLLVIGVDYLFSDPAGDLDELAGSLAAGVASRRYRTAIVGHSAGGAIALAAAALLGPALSALVVCSTGPNTIGHGQPKLVETAGAPDGSPCVLELFPGLVLPAPLRDQLVEYADRVPDEALLKLFQSQREIDLTDRLDDIRCPTLIIHGTHDPRRPSSHGAQLAAGIPGARLVPFDTGHNPMLEAPERFEREVTHFLEETAMAPGGWTPAGACADEPTSTIEREPTLLRHATGFSGEETLVYFERMDPARQSGLPPVLMLHGRAHSGACYQVTPDGRPGWAYRFVESGFPVMVPDWPGHARSGTGAPDTLTGEAVCQAFARLVEDLGCPIILLTHSMAGAMGWRLLELCVEQIEAVVAVAAGPPGNMQPEADIVDENSSEITVQTMFGPISLPKTGMIRGGRDWAIHAVVGSSTYFPRSHLEPYIASLCETNVRLMLERLNVHGSQVRVENPGVFEGKPVVAVSGTNDVLQARSDDQAMVAWLKSHGAKAEQIWLGDRGITGNGHMLMLEENSDRICDVILEWIKATLPTELSI